ncbi:MAG: heme exporter protein CcmB [Myxococcales bacterium]|nr:heme exporter protein CcmB [Myxococcales bacterium]
MSASFAIRPIGLLRAAGIILGKDLLIEWRTRARINALVFFAVATLLLFSFALGPDVDLLRQNAAGYMWLGILFASVLSLSESFRVEAENATLEGLKLVPTDPRAVFLGKACGNAVMIFALCLILLPVMVAIYDVSIAEGLPKLSLVLAIGCLAISAPGTIFAAISANARARDVLLPLLLFPMLVPALLSVVKATALVLQGDLQDSLRSWLGLLCCFSVIYWALGFAVFPKVIED